MDKIISNSIIYTGFLIVSFLLVNFVTSSNYAFAIEYNNFTSKTWGIEFQYPSEWKVTENSRFDENMEKISIYNQNQNTGEQIHILVVDDSVINN